MPDLDRLRVPLFDEVAMRLPGLQRVGEWIEALALKALSLLGKRRPTPREVAKARSMKTLVRPPEARRFVLAVLHRMQRE